MPALPIRYTGLTFSSIPERLPKGSLFVYTDIRNLYQRCEADDGETRNEMTQRDLILDVETLTSKRRVRESRGSEGLGPQNILEQVATLIFC